MLSHRAPPAFRQSIHPQAPSALRPTLLAGLLAASAAASAQQQSPTPPATPAAEATARGPEVVLPRIVTTATRIEANDDAVPATVSTREARDIARSGATDLKSLFDDEPGIAVRRPPARMSAVFSAAGRGGNEGINVRGLEGNQVLLQVDGVRLPMFYESGPYVAGRGDYLDIEGSKRVELLRGPSSASYGSDGLAGAVSFLTKDPADLLTLGQPSQASLKLGYSSASREWLAVPSFAMRQGEGAGAWQALVLASLRRGHEIDNRGDRDTRNAQSTVPNPQDRQSDYVLGKLLYTLDARHQLKLTLEHLDRRNSTDPIYTVVGMQFVNANVIDARATEHVTRSLGKLDWVYTDLRNPWVQRLSAWVYGQDTANHQFGQERYTSPPAAWARRTRDTTYGERTLGTGLQGESTFGGAAVAHRVVWGADYSDARITSLKEGAHFAADGSLITSGSASAAATLPNQSFPDSDYRQFGAFAQDEVAIGAWRITPSLRFDRYEIDPDTGNPLYTRNNSVTPTRLSSQAVSPRLGVVWQWQPLLQPYAQVARGFRTPTPWQINGGVSNSTANPPYRSIGNPDLKPEHSQSFELGLRGRDGALRWGLALFKSRYRDFIVGNTDVTATTTVPLDAGMASTTRTFQSVNAARAEIQGFELQGEWRFAPGWAVEARYAHARGDQFAVDGSSSPLSTIEPDKGTLALRYERKNAFGGELLLVGQKSQHRPYASGLYIPAGYITADLSAWWQLSRHWELNANLQNIGDVKYMNWADVRGITSTTTVADAYSQPGRHLNLSARYQF
ncbi:TonB-dependent hemoglobin/transferrin/lactoferrin family receptor [Aquabacterium sp. OR-4]|uniref:TonB-dependent hemoglobin/transferrin/lactoferrin family receptor n=1 Tax=Aquabacterium sp. OR-4 TaxID=2978127 RepID=UPI0021B2597D|nr:TonB-dependent hemoglobin/transferrin/lactoferrin family receptor [Aquabacterium sp. OR-4]MDT7838105.1 TonB-dependent hemoglobin/transferrin/lactoferrin family receptor [Aquabacterium sp. OR-4]